MSGSLPTPIAENSGAPERLILPMGHYVGARRTSADAGPEFHLVRVGWEIYRLDGTDQLTMWALAHGVPGGNDMAPWTRAVVEGAARLVGIPDAVAILDDLMRRELVVEITPGTARAVEFAQVCRTRSLLTGLGNSADEPLLYEIGLAGAKPAATVSGFAFELWKWAHTCDSLWHACQILARTGRALSPENPDQTDPERLLSQCLAAIQVLIAQGVVYLDEAREQWDQDETAQVEERYSVATTSG